MYATVEIRYADPSAGGSVPYTGHAWITIFDAQGNVVDRGGFNPSAPGAHGAPGAVDFETGGADWTSPPIPITQNQYDAFRNFKEKTDNTAIYRPLGGDGETSFNCATWAYAALDRMEVPLQGDTGAFRWVPGNLPDAFYPREPDGDPFGGMPWPGMPMETNELFKRALNWTWPRDPLVLDLDNDGIEAKGIDPAAPILFDMDADGIRTGTGWIKADDGLLVLDRNGTGTIDSGRELFGDQTILQRDHYPDFPGGRHAGETAADGFQALDDLDSNADGRIDSADPVFAQLRVWQDANQDGISQFGELKTLAALGIASIRTLASNANRVDLGEGNTQILGGSFTRTNGTVGASGVAELSGSLLLANNNFYREFSDDPEVTPAAAALPQMGGSGLVRDLREAMSLPGSEATTLRAKMTQYAAATTREEQMTLLDGLIQAWADTADLPSRRVESDIAGYDRHATLGGGSGFDWQGSFGAVFGAELDAKGYNWRATDGSVDALGGMLVAAGIVQGYAADGPSGNTSSVFGIKTWSQTAWEAYATEFPDRALAVQALEAFNGEILTERFLIPRIVVNQQIEGWQLALPLRVTELLDQAYEALQKSVYEGLVTQTRLAPYLDAIGLVIDEQGLSFDTSGLSSGLEAVFQDDPTNAVIDLAELLRFAGQPLAVTGFIANGTAMLREWLAVLGLEDGLPALLQEMHVLLGSDLAGSASGDILLGDSAAGVLRGGEGNDILDGGAGNDILAGGYHDTWNGNYGGPGNDTYLFGRGDGQDRISDLDTTAGNTDSIVFKAGVLPSDIQLSRSSNTEDLILKIAGTSDQLTILNYFLQDASSGHAIEDIRFTGSASTVWTIADVKLMALWGTEGNDTLKGYATDDTLTGNAGNDDVEGRGGNDVLEGGQGGDRLWGGAGNDTLRGGAEDDLLQGSDGDDVLDGGSGDDILAGGYYDTWNGNYAGPGNDTYLFGQGDSQDRISDVDSTPGNTDKIVFKAGVLPSDIQLSRSFTNEDLILKIAGTGDQLTIANYFFQDATSGHAIEEIRFTDSASTVWTIADVKAMALIGSAGNDYLKGYATDDTVTGNEGNDDVEGRGGNDVLEGGQGGDRLWGGAGNDTLRGDADDDLLQGGEGDDVLDGGSGDDILGGGFYDTWNSNYTGPGNDTYLFGRGDGQDRINDLDTTAGNTDRIVFKAGVLPSDIQISRASSAEDLILKIAGTSDQLTVLNYFLQDGTSGHLLEEIRFADSASTVWTVADVKARALLGGAGNDTLKGYATDDTVAGNGGNDDLEGRGGNDVLEGGQGGDRLWGGAGNDTLRGDADDDLLQGGEGDDVLDGGSGDDILGGGFYDTWNSNYTGPGNDTYLFGRGDGQDRINDLDTTAGNIDRIVFKAGVLPSDIQISRASSAEDLILKIAGTSDQLTVLNYFLQDASSGHAIEEIRFTDSASTVWTVAHVKAMALIGSAGNDYLKGYATDDTVAGNGGNDDLEGRGGYDVLEGGQGGDRLWGGAGNDTLRGGADDDLLQGGEGDDVLDGGSGDDILGGGFYDTWNGNYTGPGNDTYLFGRGDGQDRISDLDTTPGNTDQVVFKAGVLPADVQVSRISGSEDLLLKIAGTTDQLRLANYLYQGAASGYVIEEIRFADDASAVWAAADVLHRLFSGNAPVVLTAIPQQSTQAATAWSYAVPSSTFSDADNGNGDVLTYSASLSSGSALPGWLSFDPATMSFSGSPGSANAGRVSLRVTATDKAGQSASSGFDLEISAGVGITLRGSGTLQGTDYDDTLIATASNATLQGGSGNDVLDTDSWYYSGTTYIGGAGNDTMQGVYGSDTYLFSMGDGRDVIKEASNGSSHTDVLRFGAGIAPADIVPARNGADLVLQHVNGDERVTVANWFAQASGTTQIERTEFANGTLWSAAQINARVLEVFGGPGVDQMTGSAFADVLHGGAGNDLLIAVGNGDTLYGDEGNDVLDTDSWYLSGTTFIGGTGNDTIQGVYGSDTYRFARGDGQDLVKEASNGGAHTDVLQFDTGIATDQLWFLKVGNHLEVRIIGTADAVTIQNWYAGPANRIEQFKTVNGLTLHDEDIDELVDAMNDFDPPALGETTLPTAYATALSSVIADNWVL